MKKVLFLIVMWAVCGGWASAQTALEVVWEKNVWPKSIGAAFFSADGQYLYCVEGGTIVKRSATNGDSLTTFERGFVTGIYNNLGRISTKGNYISTISAVWDVKNEKALKEIKIPNQSTNQGLGLSVFYPDENTILFCVVTDHENSPTTVDMVKFDWVNDTIINKCAINGNLAQYEISHDGKTFVTGTTYKELNAYYDELTLWDAESMKLIKLLDKSQSQGYGFQYIKYSDDDKFIGSLASDPRVAKYFSTSTYEKVGTSSYARSCMNFAFFRNSNYVANCHDSIFVYDLMKKEDVSVNPYYAYLFVPSSTFDIFFSFDGENIRLLRAKATDILGTDTYTSVQFKYENGEIYLIATELYYGLYKFNISDLNGKTIYADSLLLDTNTKTINLELPTGTYIATIYNKSNTFSYKLIVTR